MGKKFNVTQKSYCNNSDLFYDAPLPRPRKLSDAEVKRRAKFIRYTLCAENVKIRRERVEEKVAEAEQLKKSFSEEQVRDIITGEKPSDK